MKNEEVHVWTSNGDHWLVIGEKSWSVIVVWNYVDEWLVIENNGDQWLVIRNNGN